MKAAPLLVLAAAALLVAFGDLGRLGAAALAGAAGWLALRTAGRPLPLQFAALALFGAVIFGFTAAAFAALHGLSSAQLLALPLTQQPVGVGMAWLAVALASLGVCSGIAAMVAPPVPAPADAADAVATDAAADTDGQPPRH